jgi:hypothetical protein
MSEATQSESEYLSPMIGATLSGNRRPSSSSRSAMVRLTTKTGTHGFQTRTLRPVLPVTLNQNGDFGGTKND